MRRSLRMWSPRRRIHVRRRGRGLLLAAAVGIGLALLVIWLLDAALCVLAGLALRRLCTRRSIILGAGALRLFTLLFAAACCNSAARSRAVVRNY